MAVQAVRNTRQKAAIERVVLSSCDHPTAETVYNRVRGEIDNISLGTVYRVLGALAEQGRIREIAVPGAPSRFDKTTQCHAHFLCSSCGEITDISLQGDALLDRIKVDFPEVQVDEAEVILKGLCDKCRGIKL